MAAFETVIRGARPADAKQLVVLQQGIYSEGRWFVGTTAPSVDTIRRRLQYLNPHNSLYLVAERNRQLLGWLELNRLQPERMQHVALLTIAIGADRKSTRLNSSHVASSYAVF